MKKNNLKKYSPLILSVSFLAVGILSLHFLTQGPSIKKNETVEAQKTDAKVNTNKEQDSFTGAYRKIASVPTSRELKLYKDRQVIGQIPEKSKVVFSNRVSKKWQQNYKSNITRMLDGTTAPRSIRLTRKRSLIRFRGNVGRYLEHVLVQMTKADGSPYSYEALIDSQTGSLVRSWNKTRYEFKQKSILNLSGKGVKSLEL